MLNRWLKKLSKLAPSNCDAWSHCASAIIDARRRHALQQLCLQDVVALQHAAALVQHREQAMRAVDVAGEDDDEVALLAQIIGETPALAFVEGGELAAKVLAHRQQPLLGQARRLEGRQGRAGAARLHVVFEEAPLTCAQLDAKPNAVQSGRGSIGGDQLIEAVAPAPAPSLSSQIAQYGGQNRERHQPLLAIDDLEQARLALAPFRQISAAGLEQKYGTQKIVGLRRRGITANPGSGQHVIEELARLRGGPRVRPLVVGNRKVER